MRKIISVFGTLLLILVFAVGCNAQKTSPQPSNQTSQTSQTPAQGNSDLGKKVFEYNCSGCHSTDNTTSVGPGLKGIFGKEKLANGNPVNDTNLVQLIKSGSGRMSGNTSLSESDLANLITYLKTLR